MIDSLDQIDGDLLSALGSLRSRLQSSLAAGGIDVHWQVQELPQLPDLGADRSLQIIRIVQEAITNVIKHSDAGSLALRSYHTFLYSVIEIEDDGIGLRSTESAGRGLDNMSYRAARAGVLLSIVSINGTLIRLSIPHN